MSSHAGPYSEEGRGTQRMQHSDDEQRGFGWGPEPHRRGKKEKPFFLTSEFMTLLATVAAVAIAAAVVEDFDANRAWTLITVLAGAYIISRGLSKINRGDGNVDR